MRNGAGTYSIPNAPFIFDTVISETPVNGNFSDIANALTASIANDGQTPILANLQMSGYKHTGVAPTSGASSRTEYTSTGTMQDGVPLDAGYTGGTSTAYTATLSPAIAAYADKQCFRVIFNAASGATPTINFNSVGAKKIYQNVGGAAVQITTNDIPANFPAILRYDTTLDGAAGAFWIMNLSAGLSASIAFTGDISPAQITSDQNDYNPTGLSGASCLRINSDAARNITGLQGGADGRIMTIYNVGSFAITLVDESASSSAANRFANSTDLVIGPDEGVFLQYDSTSSRWRSVRPNVQLATQAQMETGTTTLAFVSPGRQIYHPGHPKAWCNFVASTAAITADYGISSVTDNTTGNFSPQYDVAFSSTAYAVVANGPVVGTGGGADGGASVPRDLATGSCRIVTFKTTDGILQDNAAAHFVAFGDQ